MLRNFILLLMTGVLMPCSLSWSQSEQQSNQSGQQSAEQTQNQQESQESQKANEDDKKKPPQIPGALKKPPVKVEFVDRFDKRYLTQEPQLGTIIEWIDGLDENGNEFDAERIKGKYSVFVFGCLT